ncbi:TPA: hypothetical protein ACGBG5_001720 [Enterococcus faecalis]
MLIADKKINDAWSAPDRELRIRIRMNAEVFDDLSITSFSFDSGSISGENFQIGSTYMNKISIVFNGLLEFVQRDMEMMVEIGIKVDDIFHYSKLGIFFISDFDRNRNDKKTSVTAFDRMFLLGGKYDSKLTYPAKIRDVALEVANLSGAEIDPISFSTLPTATINKPEGYTYRQSIGLIAQFIGGFANFNREGKLQIKPLTPTEFVIKPANYLLKGFKKNEATYRVNGIKVITGKEESDFLQIGTSKGNVITLENKVMTPILLERIWLNIQTMSYFPFELKWQGNPNLEAGDWIYIFDRDGTRYSVPNLSYSITYNGGMRAESKATTTSSSEVAYRYRGPIHQQIQEITKVLENANGWNANYYDSETEPQNPKPGDLWFKENGKDSEIWIYREVDGVIGWQLSVSSAPNEELSQSITSLIEESNKALASADAALTKADAAILDAGFAKNQAQTATLYAQEAINTANTSNGALTLLKTTVDEQAGKLTTLSTNVAGNSVQLNKLKTDFTGLQSTVSRVDRGLTDTKIMFSDFQQTVKGFQTTVQNDIGNVKTQLTQLDDQFTVNVMNLVNSEELLVSHWEPGYINSEGVEDNTPTYSSYSRTGYIHCVSGSTYTFYDTETALPSINARFTAFHFYDVNKIWVGKSYLMDSKDSKTVKVPFGAVYMRVVYGKYYEKDPITENVIKGTEMKKVAPVNQAQLSVLTTAINMRVQKGELVGELNIEAGKTLITQGTNLLMVTPETTYIQNATIKDAMIASVSANKLTAGIIDANVINVINFNAKNIVSGSITGDKLAANALQIGLNNFSSVIKLNPFSLDFYDGGKKISSLTSYGQEFWSGTKKLGRLGKNSKLGDPTVEGITMDLEFTGDFITWGYKKSATDTSYTSMLTLDPKGKYAYRPGIHLDTDVYMTRVKPKTITVTDFLEFSVISYNNISYSGLTNASGKSGIFMGAGWLYLLHDNNVYPFEDIKKVVYALKGLGAVKIPRTFRSDGSIATYANVTL